MRLCTVLLCLSALVGCKSSSSADAALAEPVSPAWLEGTLPPETTTPRDGGTLVVRVMNEPACLNHLADHCRDGWVSRMTNRLVTQTLLAPSATDATLRPELASEWIESEDHTVSTFTLRPGLSFSDGSPLTSADVIATLDAVMDVKRPTGAIRGEFSALGAWKAIDATHLQLTWSKPSPFALRALARLPILSSKELAGDWTKTGLPAKSPVQRISVTMPSQ